MGLIYLVRKKMFPHEWGMKSLYYAVQRKLQKRGGRDEKDLANIFPNAVVAAKVKYSGYWLNCLRL